MKYEGKSFNRGGYGTFLRHFMQDIQVFTMFCAQGVGSDIAILIGQGDYMNFRVVETKAGFAVQNMKTYSIVILYPTKVQAEKVVKNLNLNKKV